MPSPIISKETASNSKGFNLSFQLLKHWEAMYENRCAQRRNLDPIILGPALLPHLVIIDVLDNGRDYVWRLFGGAHTNEYGFNLTKVQLSALMQQNEGLTEVKFIFEACTKTKKPVFYEMQYTSNNSTLRNCTGILLPLFEETNQIVTQLLGCTEWHNA